MPTRVAGTLSLVAFAAALVAGAFVGGNDLTTSVLRALYAMGGTFAVGLIVGWMAQAMVRENLQREADRLAQRRAELVEQAARHAAEHANVMTVG